MLEALNCLDLQLAGQGYQHLYTLDVPHETVAYIYIFCKVESDTMMSYKHRI